MRRQRVGFLVAVTLTLCMLAGCPTGDKWQKSATASNDLISTVEAAQQTEIGFYHAGKIDAADHVKVEQGFKKIAQVDKALNNAILKASSTKDAGAAFQVAFDATDEALNDGTFSVKDPNVSAAIRGSIAATRVILVSIRTIATGK